MPAASNAQLQPDKDAFSLANPVGAFLAPPVGAQVPEVVHLASPSPVADDLHVRDTIRAVRDRGGVLDGGRDARRQIAVANQASEQQKVVPFSQLAKDIAGDTLPDYSIIVPDLIHDAHNASPQSADQWLKKNIGPLLKSSYFHPGGDSVMFITFDNGDNDDQGQVFTAVVGQRVILGVTVNTPFRHENTLRTIMELLGLKTFPGASANAAPMNEFFQ